MSSTSRFVPHPRYERTEVTSGLVVVLSDLARSALFFFAALQHRAAQPSFCVSIRIDTGMIKSFA